MQCPPEIAVILCEILQTGLLRIRILDDPARSRIEADHLHNLPRLLIDYHPQLLEYYWNVERTCYMGQSTAEENSFFDTLWESLGQRLGVEKSSVAVR